METIKRIAIVIALTCGPAAWAQTFMIPDADCGTVTLEVTRGTASPDAGEAIYADRVAEAYMFLPKRRIAVTPAAGHGALDFEVAVPDEGVVMASVGFRPVVSGNETRTEHAKAFIFCGPAPVADWQRSVGLGLEIYPQGWNGPRPHFEAGDAMRFIVVEEATNKLLRDLPMELHRMGAGRIADGVPAEHGGMNFPFPEPGRYMVVARYRRADPQQPDHWLVDTSTLTFEVK